MSVCIYTSIFTWKHVYADTHECLATHIYKNKHTHACLSTYKHLHAYNIGIYAYILTYIHTDSWMCVHVHIHTCIQIFLLFYIYAYIYIFTFKYACVHPCMSGYTHTLDMHTYVCTDSWMCVHTHKHIQTEICTHIQVHICIKYASIHPWMSGCMHTYSFMPAYIQIYMHTTYLYVCIQTYVCIHIYTQSCVCMHSYIYVYIHGGSHMPNTDRQTHTHFCLEMYII